MNNYRKEFDRIEKSCESTPFKRIECNNGSFNISLYWTLRAGNMGYQVHSLVRDYRNDETVCTFDKTSSYGHSKEDAALANAFTTLGIKPKQMRLGSHSVPHDYHVGGNYYKIPSSHMCKIK